MSKKTAHPYWLDIKPLLGSKDKPKGGGICIIGSGLAGASTAHFLQEQGYQDLTMLDYQAEQSATFRNCGHILHGTVESMKALTSIHGPEAASKIWRFSVDICQEVQDTVHSLGIDCDYKQDGYLVMAINQAEFAEIQESVALLNDLGYQNQLIDKKTLESWGFNNVVGGRYEPGSAQAHPVKFRNGLLEKCLSNGLTYHSDVKVVAVEESSGQVSVKTENFADLTFDAAVIAANAYSPLLSDFFSSHRLVEPFRGQIITSKPLNHNFKVRYPHSFDHGYEYALVTEDNRLMIGGWRNNTPKGEIGTYDTSPNHMVEEGLKNFTKHHYKIDERIDWEYSWGGIMATSRTGFPFIGPTSSPLIFTVAGFTGHGFSWAHGSAKLLVDIMVGNHIPSVASYFNSRIIKG